jgi:hypothetical protein
VTLDGDCRNPGIFAHSEQKNGRNCELMKPSSDTDSCTILILVDPSVGISFEEITAISTY